MRGPGGAGALEWVDGHEWNHGTRGCHVDVLDMVCMADIFNMVDMAEV